MATKDEIDGLIDNPEAVVDVPDDFDPMELESSSDTDQLDLEPVVSPSDEIVSNDFLVLLTERAAQAQRKARTERIRRQDIARYNEFLQKNGVPNQNTFKDIRVELEKLVKKRTDGAQVVLNHLNVNHGKKLQLRL